MILANALRVLANQIHGTPFREFKHLQNRVM